MYKPSIRWTYTQEERTQLPLQRTIIKDLKEKVIVNHHSKRGRFDNSITKIKSYVPNTRYCQSIC